MERLTAFGLSVNQAKVYLSIVRSTKVSVATISSDTKIHRQDIYKILPKLEEMGLITKTVELPIIISVIPPEKALKGIIANEQCKANQKIRQLKEICNELTKDIEEAREKSQAGQEQNEIQAVFLVTDKAVNNRFDIAFENSKIQCDGVFNFALMQRRLPLVEKRYQALYAHKVKTRIIIDNLDNAGAAQKILKQVIPCNCDFAVRQNTRVTVKPYLIIDNKEIFITSQRKTSGNFPCVFWTNSKNIITVYQDNFEKAWDKSQPIIISE